jgi:hypothetical protein
MTQSGVMPNSAFESGRAEERRVLVPVLAWRAAERER